LVEALVRKTSEAGPRYLSTLLHGFDIHIPHVLHGLLQLLYRRFKLVQLRVGKQPLLAKYQSLHIDDFTDFGGLEQRSVVPKDQSRELHEIFAVGAFDLLTEVRFKLCVFDQPRSLELHHCLAAAFDEIGVGEHRVRPVLSEYFAFVLPLREDGVEAPDEQRHQPADIILRVANIEQLLKESGDLLRRVSLFLHRLPHVVDQPLQVARRIIELLASP
jgi:hypothetical protein